MIFSKEEVKVFRQASAKSSPLEHLCDSHEELRKERDELMEKYRLLRVEVATIREKKANAESGIGTGESLL